MFLFVLDNYDDTAIMIQIRYNYTDKFPDIILCDFDISTLHVIIAFPAKL